MISQEKRVKWWRSGPPPTYLWDSWFAKGKFKLRRGVHYQCGDVSMAQQARSAASRRGLGLSLRETPDGLAIAVRDKLEEN